MSEKRYTSASEADSGRQTTEPAVSDPFTDEEMTSIIDAAWDDLGS